MQAKATIAGKQDVVRDRQQLHPDADQRQIEHDQQQVPDPHRDDQSPEQGRLVVDDVGPGRDALDDERADHERHHRVRRQAQGQQRDERGLGRRVVRRFGAGHAFDRAVTERLRMLRDALLQGVGGEGGEDVPGAGQDAEHRAERRARGALGPTMRPKILARQPQVLDRVDHRASASSRPRGCAGSPRRRTCRPRPTRS